MQFVSFVSFTSIYKFNLQIFTNNFVNLQTVTNIFVNICKFTKNTKIELL